MLEEESAARLTASVVEEAVAPVNGLSFAIRAKHTRPQNLGMYRVCCRPEALYGRGTAMSLIQTFLAISPLRTEKITLCHVSVLRVSSTSKVRTGALSNVFTYIS
jgi:hypothetical protein